MNILRLVVAEKEKKSRPNPEFQKIEASAISADRGEFSLKPDKNELRKKLSPVEYHVTQDRGTERLFLYVCQISPQNLKQAVLILYGRSCILELGIELKMV